MINEIQPKIKFQNIVQCPFNELCEGKEPNSAPIFLPTMHHFEMSNINPYQGFYVTSYGANFASHHARDHHVGFLSPQSGIRKHD